MDWFQIIEKTIEYIEDNLTEKIDYETLAKRACSSTFHFQRMFSIICGFTLGEYIRKRRLTIAGMELLNKNTKVIDVAFKYVYETPESFSRSFKKFHGIMPSNVKNGCTLKCFPRLKIKDNLKGVSEMKYRIEEREEMILVGYKRTFSGSPYGEERLKQEENFITTTRAKQWLLLGASSNYSTDYMVVSNIDDYGYNFYVAYELDEWTREELFNPSITGVDFIDKLGFETIVIPKHLYAIFETERKKRPIEDYTSLRKRIVNQFNLSSEYLFSNSPEVVAMHWRPNGNWEKERYIEICIPVEKKQK